MEEALSDCRIILKLLALGKRQRQPAPRRGGRGVENICGLFFPSIDSKVLQISSSNFWSSPGSIVHIVAVFQASDRAVKNNVSASDVSSAMFGQKGFAGSAVTSQFIR